MSAEVLVNTDDITVLGPPAQVNVQLDIGATGNRGSQIFVGTGNPNSGLISLLVNAGTLNSTLPVASVLPTPMTALMVSRSVTFAPTTGVPPAGF